MATAAELAVLLTVKDLASQQLEGFGQKLGGLGAFGKVAAVGLAGVAAAGLGLVAGIGSAVGQATEFEAAMSAVAAVAGGTDADLKRLADTALQLGQDTTLSGIGATDAATAMRELAAAGLSVDQIIGGAALGALRLASAGGLEVGRAAEIAAMALANFGLSGDQAARVADLFAAAANSSAIGVDDIAESMKYVGPIANSMGLSIEEVTATIAALGNQGIKGSQSGTALRSMLVSLAKPSKEATKLIDQLGLSFFDSSGKMKTIAGISEELKGKLAGLSDKQRAAALATLFGNEALTAATVLYGEGAEGIGKWLTEVTNGATAAEVGAKRNDNLRGALESLKSSAETAAISFGRGLTPALQGLVQQFAAGVSAAIPFLTALGTGLGAALTAGVGALGTFIGYVARAATAIGGAWQKLQDGEITLAQFIGGLKTLAATVLGDIGRLLGRVGEVVGPFLASVGAGLRAALPIIGGELANLGRAFGGWIAGTAIPALQAALPAWGAALWDWITNTAVPTVTGRVVGLANALTGWIAGTAIPYLQTNLPIWGAALWDWITNTAVPTVVGRVVGLANALSDWVTTIAVPYLQAKLPEWGNAIWGYITQTAVPTVQGQAVALGIALADWVNTEAVPRLQAYLPVWNGTILTWLETTNANIQGATDALGHALSDWVATVAVPLVGQNMDQWSQTILKWIALSTAAIPIAAYKAGEALAHWIVSKAIPDTENNMDRWVQVIVDKIIWGTTFWIRLAWEAGQGVGRGIAEGLLGEAARFGTILYKAGQDIINGLLLGIQSRFGAVQALLGNLTNMLPRWKGPPEKDATLLFESGQLIMQGLIDGIDDKQLDLQKKLAEVTSGIARAATDMLGAFKALAAFDFANNSPSGETLGWFAHLMESVIQTLRGVAERLGTDGLAAAKQVAESVGPIGSAVKSTLEGFKALAEYDFTQGSPTGDAMGWFTHLMESIVLNFAGAAQKVGGEGLAQAQAFAKAVAEVIATAKSGLDLFSELEKLRGLPEDALWALFEALGHALQATKSNANRAHDILTEALAFRDTMKQAAQAMAAGLAFGEGLPAGTALAPGGAGGAPAGVAGAGGAVAGGAGAGGGGAAVTVNLHGNQYGFANFHDAVVDAVEQGQRRGRLA